MPDGEWREPPADPEEPTFPMWLAALLVFASSAAVLVLEITSLRLIAPYVGITLKTNTAVIGLALTAIAVGAWSGGAVADRRRPRSLLGPLLLVGGAFVILVTPAIRLATAAVGTQQARNVALLVAAVTVFVPAAVLSAVPPTVVKLVLSTLRRTGTVVGRLSGVSTLGAIIATFLTGLVLVAVVPTSVILLATGGLLVVGGVSLGVTERRRGVRLGRGVAAAVALALTAGVGSVLVPSPCDVETQYHCASIVTDPARPGGRTLVLDTLRHSYVDLDDPTYLQFPYMRAIASVVESRPSGRLDVLHVGGGGMTLPRYLLQARPEARSHVVEIDAGIVDLDRSRLGLPDDPRLEVEVEDGRLAVQEVPTGSYDAYVGDAFGGIAVPWHLTTVETFRDVARVLRLGGVVTLNVIDHGPLTFARAELATVASVFPYVALVTFAGLVTGGNIVIVASDRPLDRDALTAAFAAHQSPMLLVPEATMRDFIGPAPLVLTDDYAPVDQLFTP